MVMTRMEQAREALQEYFGYGAFHPGQEALIGQLLAGRNVLGIMPTGAGKSLCYQIPALLMPGITVVVSPLISLMKDQVDGLRRMGIPAALLNSSISAGERDKTLRALRGGDVKLLYIAPERMEAAGFTDFLATLEVSMVAVDEAHCVSQWGHDFRPSYRRIRELIAALPGNPLVCAFTATATERVREDILALLGLGDAYVLTTGFDRANLYFAVHAPADREAFALDYLRENRGSGGVIYCLTRKGVEKLADTLVRAGISALPYHAGLPDEVRKANQEAFQNDTVDVIVATNAFGMGIDKSNVRFVLHCGMPRTLESYYQEAGRAGRDGEKADCILLFNAQDIVTNRFFIENNHGDNTEQVADSAEEYRKLQQMVDYCNVDTCLRAYILRYFGMQEVEESCGNCHNCCYSGEKTDITVEAQKILSCVRRMGNRFGSLLVTQVLRGANTQKIRQLRFNELSTYGIMREYSEKAVKELISYLVTRGYLEMRGGEYPVLFAGAKAMEFLRSGQPLYMKRAIRAQEKTGSRTGTAHPELFERLRALRREIAGEQGVPPYLIFSDATLVEMCAVLPRDGEELALVSGVGRFKREQYGEEFVFCVKQYMDERDVSTPVRTGPPKPQGGRQTAGDSAMESYELYRQGKTIEEIAAERGIGTQTVEKHLVQAHREGQELDLESFIPSEHRESILRAIAEQGAERLRPIKDSLPEEVSYTAIRFAVELYRERKGTGEPD